MTIIPIITRILKFITEVQILHAITFSTIALSSFLILTGSFQEDFTYDESGHLNFSKQLFYKRIANPEKVYNSNVSRNPVNLVNVFAERVSDSLFASWKKKFFTRSITILWFFLLLLAVFLFIKPRLGEQAACLTAIAISLDPNIIAHSGLITVDMAYAFATIAVLFAFVKFVENPCFQISILVGVALGFAFCTKVTACILLISCTMSIPLAIGLKNISLIRPTLYLRGFLVIVAVATCTICTGYMFVDVGFALSEFEFRSNLFQSLARTLPDFRVPLPHDFLAVIDGYSPKSIIDNPRALTERVVIFGQIYKGGVWFYFVALWFLKTPVLLIIACLVGLWRSFSLPLYKIFCYRFFLINFVIHLIYFSFFFHNQIGFRYFLMGTPLFYILCAPGLVGLMKNRIGLVFLSATLVISAIESLYYFGNPISFTNFAVQPKRDVYRLITDSNVSWGQNNMKIRRMVEEKGILHPIWPQKHIQPGYNVIELNRLSGASWNFDQYMWVRENLTPDQHFGHTHLGYNISDDIFDRFMNEKRFVVALEDQVKNCRFESTKIEITSQKQLDLKPINDAYTTWLVCVEGDKTTDVSFLRTPQKGSARLEFLSMEGKKIMRTDLPAKEKIWYRLQKGLHAFHIESREGSQITVKAQTPGTVLLVDLGTMPIKTNQYY